MENKDKIERDEYCWRGRDYPAYNINGVKMHLGMPRTEVEKWFSKAELEGYPRPDAYVGSLP